VARPPMRNPRVASGAPQHYVPPNRRNGPPGGGRGWNNGAPRGAPQRPGPLRMPQNPAPRGASWNPAPAPAPRNVAPRGPPGGAPSHIAPTTSTPHLRAPTVNESRSSSSNVAGAPTRSSRSNSREPQNTRMSASRAPTMSTPPRSSQPPVRPTPTQPSGVVLSFDTKHIIFDYIVTKLRMAGVPKPTKILVDDGRARVFFSSAADADLASKTQILYDNGVPMQVCLTEKVEESKV